MSFRPRKTLLRFAGSSPDAASQAASPPPAAAEAIAALSAASSSSVSGSGGRTEELLQQLIELQVRQAKETTTRQEASAKLERLQRRMENRTTRASAVAGVRGQGQAAARCICSVAGRAAPRRLSKQPYWHAGMPAELRLAAA